MNFHTEQLPSQLRFRKFQSIIEKEFLLRDFSITWGENQNVTEPPKVENEEVSHGFMDSLLYVMIPSLLSFFALFWAFYALHSYTVDTKVVSQLYQRMKESRNSIRQKFTNSGPGSIRVRRTSDTDLDT